MLNKNAVNCRSCNAIVQSKYCGQCGELVEVKRISLHGLVHDVLHFFTHVDHGFLYTIKALWTMPGDMQLNYVNGDRSRYQKPFSLFFILATILFISKYWVAKGLIYYGIGEIHEADFSHKYMVQIQILLVPFYALLTYLFFKKSKFNYAETGVMLMYTTSFFFTVTTIILITKFIFPNFDSGFIEFPLLIIYNSITFVNFYKDHPKWLTVTKSIIIFIAVVCVVRWIENFGPELIK